MIHFYLKIPEKFISFLLQDEFRIVNIIIIIIIIINAVIFHWSLIDSKSSLISRTFLSILAEL